jgi:hypothetical protein
MRCKGEAGCFWSRVRPMVILISNDPVDHLCPRRHPLARP